LAALPSILARGVARWEGRNATEEFARRSMKNLEFIVASLESGADGESVEK